MQFARFYLHRKSFCQPLTLIRIYLKCKILQYSLQIARLIFTSHLCDVTTLSGKTEFRFLLFYFMNTNSGSMRNEGKGVIKYFTVCEFQITRPCNWNRLILIIIIVCGWLALKPGQECVRFSVLESLINQKNKYITR